MQLGEQVKHSATWGGGKYSPNPVENKAETPSRERSNAKRAAQFLLCFGLVLTLSVNASARKISKHLSPELYAMVLNNDSAQSVDVIVQYKKRVQKKFIDDAVKKRRAFFKRQLTSINGLHLNVTLAEVSDLADDADVKYVTLDRKVKMSVDDVTAAVSADLAWSYGYD